MRLPRSSCLLAAALFCCGSLSAEGTAARLEVPIYQTVVQGHGGTGIRYWVWVKIGNEQPMAAMLDAGSTGLLVLANGLQRADELSGFGAIDASYTVGDRLKGVQAEVALAFETSSEATLVRIGVVTDAVCAGVPSCAASKTGFADYRIASEGYADQGFQAILGVSPGASHGSDPLLGNPLDAFARSWIVELPKPESQEPGRLVLDPDAEDRAGYLMLGVHESAKAWSGPLNAGIPGCIELGLESERHCGVFGFDSGASGVSVETPDSALFERIRTAYYYLTLFGEDTSAPHWRIKIEPNSFRHDNLAKGAVPLSIILPYFAFESLSILYDMEAYAVGLKQR